MAVPLKDPATPAISAAGVCYSYEEGTLALDRVDFTIGKGEFTALLASNGSGKTTLLKTLVGLLKPQQGTVRLYGRDIRKISMSEMCREIGFVLQNPNDQLFAATVEEDVAYGPRNMGLPEEEVERRVAEALDLVAASDLRKRAIHHISFGEQKRVSIAGVLAMRPSILILDEPTAGLDPAGESSMLRLLNHLNREHGITVLLATHSVDMLPLFADRIYIMNLGRVLQHGSPVEVFGNHEVIERAKLRLPYISSLVYELKRYDGLPIDEIPLTIREARVRILELIPEEMIKGRIRPVN
jgi:cobalt/nickel transport system ATP-binding protein